MNKLLLKSNSNNQQKNSTFNCSYTFTQYIAKEKGTKLGLYNQIFTITLNDLIQFCQITSGSV
jgi:hypothetical protein